MAKKRTVASPKHIAIQAAKPHVDKLHAAFGSPEADKALGSFCIVNNGTLEDDGKVYANRRQDFSSILPGISSYPELTWSDYEWYRPDEAMPGSHVAVMQACNRAYLDNGLIRNITDLMGDFTSQGIRVSHRNKKNQTFLRNWWRIVNGNTVSERFANLLYRLANVPVRRSTAVLTPKIKDEMHKVLAEADIPAADIDAEIKKKFSKEIPWRYSIMNPATLLVAGGPLASFVGQKRYAINVPAKVKQIINAPKDKLEREIVEQLPPDLISAAKAGEPYPLPADKTVVFHYKKDDWQSWGTPISYSCLKHINLYNRLILADHAALDGAISNLRIFKLGSLAEKIAPTDAAVAKLAGMLENNTGAGVVNLIWGPDIEMLESTTSVHQFLGDDKYRPTMRAIYETYGIPPTLTGGNTAGGTTNNFISLKTLIERLEYGRSILKAFWEAELKIIQKVMGWRSPGVVEFDVPCLGDENAENMLFLQLVDRGLVSDEVIQLRFGQNPDMENVRLKRETREKKSGRRAQTRSPFLQPENNEEALKKIALQTGVASPSEVGLELDEKAAKEKSLLDRQEQMAKVAKKNAVPPAGIKPKGQPGQGRPSGKKDSTKRKKKEFKPKLKAMEIWATNAQDKIAEFLNPAILDHFGKKNMRQLSRKEDEYAERIKSSVLYSLEAFSEVTESVVAGLVGSTTDKATTRIYREYLQEFAATVNRELTKDELKQIRAGVYALLRSDNV